MSNWDLMMPGMGLVAIGVAGVALSYAEIAHTFIDGMHALTGLTLLLGLVFLGAGILEGGVSTSRKAKVTTLVLIGIGIGVGLVALQASAISTLPVFAGILIVVVGPGIIIAYVAMKAPEYIKSVAAILILMTFSLVVILLVFGATGQEEIVESAEEEEIVEQVMVAPGTPIFSISILEGSAEQGNPDYEPDLAMVQRGHVIEWTNADSVVHTVTSSLDFGETFDSGLLNPNEKFVLETEDLSLGQYEYMCIVHPWMIATFVLEEPKEAVTTTVLIPEGASIQQIGQNYYDPQDITVQVGTTVIWDNIDSTIHTVTSGTVEGGPSGLFDSGIVAAGDTFEYTFNSPSVVDYFCIVHPWMVGSVTVE